MMRALALALLLICAGSWRVGAQTPPPAAPSAPALDRQTAQEVIADLQNPEKRAKLIAALRALAAASGEAHLPPAPTPAAPLALPLAPNSLGAQILVDAAGRLQVGSKRVVQSVQAVTDFQAIGDWLRETATDPQAQARFFAALWRLVLILAIGLAADILAERALRRPRRGLEAVVGGGAEAPPPPGTEAETETEPAIADEPLAAASAARDTPVIAIPLARLPFVLLRFLLELVPSVILLGFVYGLLSTPLAGSASTQVVILAVVDAFVTVQVVMAAVRSLLSPDNPGMRVFGLGDAAALAITRWVRRLIAVSVFGYALAEVGLVFGLDPDAHDALLKIVALIVHVMLVVVVFKNRRLVAGWIAPSEDDGRPLALARKRAARLWHHVAIIAILGLWLVWALGVPDGYRLLLKIGALSVVVLIAGRAARQVVLGALDRMFHVGAEPIAGLEVVPGLAGISARARSYYRLLRAIVSGIITAIILVSLLQTWGFGAFDWFSDGALGERVVSALVTIALVLFFVLVVWEGANELILRQVTRLTSQGHMARASRMRTLLPMIRAALAVVLFLIAAPVALSEIGVNIAPLLAGAGIVGVAIGFGSQKLVQDLITGVFLLLENAMQVGDWVTLAGVSGSVEALSVRTIRLRASDGSVHIIPFSAVTTVSNSNRGLGNAAVNVSVAYKEDTDRVCEALREVAAGMRKDPAFQRGMLSDLQLWGVDKIEGAVVTIAGQIVCTDSARWGVQREFHRRMKKRFEELGIEIANPTQTVLLLTPPGQQAPAQAEPSRQEAAQ
ncbi:mechanosensitive ion channel family protein [Acidibrevibacterium fodinaquatile]|uniref:mechanosensitive ion channel family protein n=1 Tax=Acidibrevibacterium fodinaquatile TaxID=1969806 RepID=UPI0013B38DEF|nr:mechanosensitive ion channel domain-containing protein [Acidibrevibacterium fodinaquatile]